MLNIYFINFDLPIDLKIEVEKVLGTLCPYTFLLLLCAFPFPILTSSAYAMNEEMEAFLGCESFEGTEIGITSIMMKLFTPFL